MNTLKILLWKEWKESRINFVFAVSVLFIFKAVQLRIAIYHFDFSEPLIKSQEGFEMITLMFCCIYGMITGIGMFAMEYTTRTLLYLMTRPVPKITVLGSKWLIGVGEMITLGLISWLLIGWIKPQDVVVLSHLPINNQALRLTIICLYPISLYFLAVFSSIIFKDTTRSTIASFILVILLIAVYEKFPRVAHFNTDNAILVYGTMTVFLTLILASTSTLIFLKQQSK